MASVYKVIVRKTDGSWYQAEPQEGRPVFDRAKDAKPFAADIAKGDGVVEVLVVQETVVLRLNGPGKKERETLLKGDSDEHRGHRGGEGGEAPVARP